MAERAEEQQGRNVIKLFKVAGIQITLDYSWFIVFILVIWSLSAGYFPRTFPGRASGAYWLAGTVATFLFFSSILVHELAHSLMAIRSGIKIPEITFFVFGGISRLSEEAQDPYTELKIALVGPLSSFALALGFWVLAAVFSGMQPSLLVAIFRYLAWINVALGVFNLIPGFPLDGGRVLRAIVWWRTNSLTTATKWASDIGKGFSVALMVLGALQIFAGFLVGGLWLLFIGMFLRGVAEGGYQEVMVRQALEDVRVQEVMSSDVVSVSPELRVTDLIHQYFLRYGYRGFPVARNGHVLGVVSLGNVKDVPREEQEVRRTEEVMEPLGSRNVIAPGDPLTEAFRKITQENQGRLIVMEGDNMAGMITRTGLMRFLEIKRVLSR